jgi:D-serine dehydratase
MNRLGTAVKGLSVAPGTSIDLDELVGVARATDPRHFQLPLMIAFESAVSSNVEVMREYCATAGVELAPHAKTSMARNIVDRQLAAGAWGMTAATVHQVAGLVGFGVRRIVLANQLVDAWAIDWIVRHVLTTGAAELACYVDSLDGVRLLESALEEAPGSPSLDVLLEMGFTGGRTGVRSHAAALDVARAVRDSGHLRLVGVAGFEGLFPGFGAGEVPPGIAGFLTSIRDAVEGIATEDLFDVGRTPLVTAGGSSYFDEVVEHLHPSRFSVEVVTVLRSGCYVTHDHGVYARSSPLAGRSGDASARLTPALELLASVVSRPEPDLLIVGCGRRDAPTDDQLPQVIGMLRDRSRTDFPGRAESFAINDQHLFVRVDPGAGISIGDVLRLGISHPCGAFDRWRLIPLVDDDYVVSGWIEPVLS